MDRVSALARERTGEPVARQRSEADTTAAHARAAELLAEPLTAETAVRIALLNNRGLQAQLSDLGLAEADRVAAGRLRGPELSFDRLAAPGALEIDRSVMVDLLDLLTLPARSHEADIRFDQAQLVAAAAAVDLADEARVAFDDAVASAQLADYARQVMETADASGALADRMAQAGNLSRLDQMREQVFRAEGAASLAKSREQADAARERLVRVLGLAGAEVGDVKLPARLPELPETTAPVRDVEQAALDRRLDILIARRDVEATARRLGLTKVTGYVDALDAGWQGRSQRGLPTESGYRATFELPLFDFGAVDRARAESAYLHALHAAADRAVRAQSEVREAYAAYRMAYDVARRYRDEVVPLHRRISEENLLRYDGMLIDVFQLLADAREQVRAVTASVEAQRDFWLAQARLQTALTGCAPAACDTSPRGLPQ